MVKTIIYRSIPCRDKSENNAEIGTEKIDNKPLSEPVDLGASTGEDEELQPSPAY